MTKVYVIGHGDHFTHSEIERIIGENIPKGVEIICVSSADEIPIKERPNCLMQSVHKLTIPNSIPSPQYYDTSEKVKGWQRPYKFHK